LAILTNDWTAPIQLERFHRELRENAIGGFSLLNNLHLNIPHSFPQHRFLFDPFGAVKNVEIVSLDLVSTDDV